jgi:hypothetical protein
MQGGDVVALITGLIWPAIALIVFFTLRGSIDSFLHGFIVAFSERGKSFNAKIGNSGFTAELHEIEKKIGITEPSLSAAEIESPQVQVSEPLGKVAYYEGALQKSLRDYLTQKGIQVPPDADLYELTRLTTDSEVLSHGLSAAIRRLYTASASAQVDGRPLRDEDAREYARLAIAIQNLLIQGEGHDQP